MHLEGITALTFDLEGTCIDVEAAHHNGHMITARSYGLNWTYEQFVASIPSFVGGPDMAIARDIARFANFDLNPLDVHKRMQEEFRKQLRTTPIIARRGLVEFLKAALADDYLLIVGSNTPMELGRHLLSASGLWQYFHTCVWAENVKRPKPYPDIYMKTATMCGITPQEQLVFEDSLVGVQAAHAAGSRVWAVPTPNVPATYLALLEASPAEMVFMKGWEDVPR